MKESPQVVVIGAGIVGLATAYQLLRRAPGRRLKVLEKELQVARHQTGHNSGVLHSGVYYRPDSSRARNCVAGRAEMAAFCEREGIPHEICGKVIVAVGASETPRLEEIHRRGVANGVACELIGAERLRELEPHVRGVRAIHVPEAGIVDFAAVARRLAERVEAAGGELVMGAQVVDVRHGRDSVDVLTTAGDFRADVVVNCAGLQSDRLARLAGLDPAMRIVPFRGEYYGLTPAARHLCRNLIYPVPDPAFPFLGVHLTRTIAGGVECGPNAVLALAREGYSWRDVNAKDLVESITYPGFLRLAGRHLRYGAAEVWRSLSKRAFLRALQRLVPEVEEAHLVPAPAGVRAQAVDRAGRLLDDFVVLESQHAVHVCNAPSPAATAALTIGSVIADMIVARSPE